MKDDGANNKNKAEGFSLSIGDGVRFGVGFAIGTILINVLIFLLLFDIILIAGVSVFNG